MKLKELLRLVLINLLANKFKLLLTSLGVIVGAATVVMVIAIGKGGEAQTQQQFADLAADTLYINPDYTNRNLDYTKLPKFTLDFVRTLFDECPSLSGVSLRVNLYEEIEIGTSRDSGPICAATPDFLEVSSFQLAAGDGFTEQHMEEEAKVAIIGYQLAKKEFGTPENALGETLRIKGKRYTIMGVLERKGDSIQGLDADESVFVPYTTAEKHLFSGYETPQITARTGDVRTVPQAKQEMLEALDYLLEEDATAFIIEDAGSRIDAATESARTMSMLLIAVSAVVFLVGGIGIMNVLFVSVRERTREIGVLKALGASRRDILLQFLLESVLLSICGGLLGIVAGNLALPLIAAAGMPIQTTVFGSVLALLFAVGTGSLFGFYPAKKAACLIPIEALNQD